jgi:flagellar biosynthesis protein
VAEKPTPSTPETAESESRRQLAVALQEDPAGTPRVVAKGRGKLAEQILAIAFDRGVKVRTDAELAEILAAIDVDSEVPLQALAAVAEILTYVYRASAQPPAVGGTP